MVDVVIIGAGLSGLTAARQLCQTGYRVLVVDKSRGLGGRLATRRRNITAIDHGCRYLQPFADSSLSPIPALVKAGVLQFWQPETFDLATNGSLEPKPIGHLYVAPEGMSAVAKALASGLTIHRHWAATGLASIPQGWRIIGKSLDTDNVSVLEARAVVVAIPAPQTAALMTIDVHQGQPALESLLQQLQTVEFESVITVMAGYRPEQPHRLTAQTTAGGWIVEGRHHPSLRWLALDSSKRTDPKESVVVAHSSAAFAAANIDSLELDTVGKELLTIAADHLAPWLKTPTWMQVHRWRYGFVHRSLGTPILSSPALPTLIGCGDWCNGGNAEGAIASGYQAAQTLAQQLG